MLVKLKDNIDLEEFIKRSFGTKGVESVNYFGYFCTDNLRKTFYAIKVGDVLKVKVIDINNKEIEFDYKDIEAKDIWEELK